MDCTFVELAQTARQTALAGGLALILAGCATPRSGVIPHPSDRTTAQSASSSFALPADRQSVEPDIYAPGSKKTPTQVLRTGRYQLVTMTPAAGQRNLLAQTVTIDLPQSMNISVAGGLENVLQHTGLSLCAQDSESGRTLFAQPLPAVHRQLGPTTLGTALPGLAGPAWRLNVDFTDRRVCFAPRQDAATGADSSEATSTGDARA
jgi:conjugative transfer region protein (TIGR03748 family)